jgi:hypothetical protein
MNKIMRAFGTCKALLAAAGAVASSVSWVEAKPLEYNVPVCIRNQQFNRSLVVRAEFADFKSDSAAAPFELVAVPDDNMAAKDASALVVFKSVANPKKNGPIQYNEICTIEAVKAGTGAWKDKAGFFAKRRLLWTFPGSKWGDKDGVHYQVRVSDDTEPGLKTDAVSFAITSPAGKTGDIAQEDSVYLVSRAPGQSNNRMVWVLNLDQSGVLPVLVSSDDPWGRDPKSGVGGDRRTEAGKFLIGEVDVQLLNDDGWRDLAKITQQGIAKPGGKYTPGGRSFWYAPAVFGRGVALYHDQWKAEHAANLWVKWRARTKSDVMVHVSTQPKWMDAAGTYFIMFGGYKNTRSQIRKGTQVVMEIDLSKGGDPTALVSGGLPGNGSMWDDYWVNLEQVDAKIVITAGKGTEVGKNVKMTWTDEQPLKFVQYVGFGGFDNVVEYEKVVISGNEQSASLPSDFVQIPGTLRSIALGVYDNRALLLGLSAKGMLLQWDTGSLKPSPWNVVAVKDERGAKISKVIDVACAADGTVALVSDKRRVYLLDRDKGRWKLVPNKIAKKKKVSIDRIALGNAGTLVGLDKKTKNIYFWHGGMWHLISEAEGLDIAAGFDGGVYALNTKHQLFVYDGKTWKRLETGLEFHMISAVSKDQLYGIALVDKKHKTYVLEKGSWEPLQTTEGKDSVGLKDILALPTNPHFIVALDMQGNVYRKGEPQVQMGDVKVGVLTLASEDVDDDGKKVSTKKSKKKTAKSGSKKKSVKKSESSTTSAADKRVMLRLATSSAKPVKKNANKPPAKVVPKK